ncbi:hypothetical protein QTG54_001070 [Skeletonema marinoi]|uniref:Calmodulin n=1 Tax=Skeletonema marinoi TaxID=267567 RepID=A0AAD8YQ37_9STRA|nr:hypothetical protein QTG54_001070 [Skeletonema marinoi]
MLATILPIIALLPKIEAFGSQASIFHRSVAETRVPIQFSKIIDAEVIADDDGSDNDNISSGGSTTDDNLQLSLVEYSQKQDPDWKSMPIAFCDTVSNSYIDCNLAFYVKDPLGQNGQGAEYSLGVPCEVPIVVSLEVADDEENDNGDNDDAAFTNLSKVIPISPEHTDEDTLSEEEKNEIFQMAARALMEEFGAGIRLKKTPRVLTLDGNLEEVIGDWKEVLLESVSNSKDVGFLSFEGALNLFDDDNKDGEDYFDKIMRRDLGDDYMSLAEDGDGEVDEELLKLFDSDSVNKDGDVSEVVDFLKNSGDSNNIDDDFDTLLQQLKPSAALRLLNFMTEDGKEVTILRPVRPMLLLGKEDPEDYTRRILLTDEEMAEVLPRLESVCREGLEKAGFFLADGNKE